MPRPAFAVAQGRATLPLTVGSHLGELLKEGVVLLEAFIVATGQRPLVQQVARLVRHRFHCGCLRALLEPPTSGEYAKGTVSDLSRIEAEGRHSRA